MIHINLQTGTSTCCSSFQGGCLREDIGAITLADVRGMVMSSWDNVNAWLAKAGEGSEGNAACADCFPFAG